MALSTMQKGSLDAAQRKELGKVTRQVVTLDGVTVTRVTYDVGARWSRDVKPQAGTESCRLPHVAMVLSGVFRVQMDDGNTEDFGANDIMMLPAGHDAWVIGNEPAVFVEFSAGTNYYTADATCCTPDATQADNTAYETLRLKKTANSCRMCEEYAQRQEAKPVAVICCEGACLRGEVARQAASLLCHSLVPEKAVRICLGGAFTKDTGQRSLVRNAARVVAVEGCHINCASRTMQAVIDGLEPEIVVADRLYDFDRTLFGIDEMQPEEIAVHARTVAQALLARL